MVVGELRPNAFDLIRLTQTIDHHAIAGFRKGFCNGKSNPAGRTGNKGDSWCGGGHLGSNSDQAGGADLQAYLHLMLDALKPKRQHWKLCSTEETRKV
jgi:hypothetical protein